MKKNAFTMIELIFVIVVLGILAAVAIPRLGATRDDAEIAKGRSDVSAIRAAIVSERQGRLLQGNSAFIDTLDNNATNDEGETIFGGNLLAYGVITADRNGHWMKTGANTYTYQVMGQPVTFTYTQANGTFTCDRTAAAPEGDYCQDLID